jgi:hypothetical protein
MLLKIKINISEHQERKVVNMLKVEECFCSSGWGTRMVKEDRDSFLSGFKEHGGI